jgi:hypothetical protein
MPSAPVVSCIVAADAMPEINCKAAASNNTETILGFFIMKPSSKWLRSI